MRKPKVFVLQQVVRRDESGGWAPKFDLSPLQEYSNDIVYIFGPGHISLIPDAANHAIESRLDEEGYDPSIDYFLPTGSPVLMGPAYHAMKKRGGVRQLVWDNRYRTYTVFESMK